MSLMPVDKLLHLKLICKNSWLAMGDIKVRRRLLRKPNKYRLGKISCISLRTKILRNCFKEHLRKCEINKLKENRICKRSNLTINLSIYSWNLKSLDWSMSWLISWVRVKMNLKISGRNLQLLLSNHKQLTVWIV